MGARFTFFDFGGPNSELRTDLTLGLTNSIGSEYYRRLGFSRWFVAPHGFYSQRQEDVYQDKTRTSVLKVREGGAGADFGYAASRFQELRLGYQYTHYDPSHSTGAPIPGLSQAAAGLQSVRFRWTYDGQDSNIIPRHGIHSTLDARWNFGVPSAITQFGVLSERLSAAKSFGPRYTLVSELGGGTIFGPTAYLPPFSLGGPGNLAALGRGQLRGDRYYYGGLQGLRAFSTDRSSFMNRVYLDLGAEVGKAFFDLDYGKPMYDGVLGVVAESPIGIVFVGASYGSSGNHRFFFRIGRLF
jgi:outer membrane protein assembly factor BamA